MIEEFRRKGLLGGAMFWSRSRLTGRRVMIAAVTLLAVAVIFSLFVALSRQPPLAPPGKVRSILRGHRGPVTAVAFSADGSALATGSWDGKVIVWDTTTAQPLHCLVFRPGTSTAEDIWPLVFAHGGDTLIASNLDGPITRVLAGRLPPQAAAFKVWNLSAGDEARTLTVPGRAHGVLVAADGRSLSAITSGKDGALAAVPLRPEGVTDGGERLLGLRTFRVLAYAPDGSVVADLDSATGVVRIIDLATSHVRSTIRQPPESSPVARVLSGQLSADGSILALILVGAANTAQLWDTATGRFVTAFDCKGPYAHPPVMAFSADGSSLAVAGSVVGQLGLADFVARSGRQLVQGRPPPPRSTRVGLVRIVDTVSGRLRHEFTTTQEGIGEIAFSTDGKTFAAASGDWIGTVILFDLSEAAGRTSK